MKKIWVRLDRPFDGRDFLLFQREQQPSGLLRVPNDVGGYFGMFYFVNTTGLRPGTVTLDRRNPVTLTLRKRADRQRSRFTKRSPRTLRCLHRCL